jgi:hypothetical protein
LDGGVSWPVNAVLISFFLLLDGNRDDRLDAADYAREGKRWFRGRGVEELVGADGG